MGVPPRALGFYCKLFAQIEWLSSCASRLIDAPSPHCLIAPVSICIFLYICVLPLQLSGVKDIEGCSIQGAICLFRQDDYVH